MEAMTSEREAFEKWARDRDLNISRYCGEYVSEGVDAAWDAWQARAHLAQVDVGAAWRDAAASCTGGRSRTFRYICEEAEQRIRALSGEKAEVRVYRCTRSSPTGDGGTYHACEYAKTEADMLILRDRGYTCELLPASPTPDKEGEP